MKDTLSIVVLIAGVFVASLSIHYLFPLKIEYVAPDTKLIANQKQEIETLKAELKKARTLPEIVQPVKIVVEVIQKEAVKNQIQLNSFYGLEQSHFEYIDDNVICLPPWVKLTPMRHKKHSL